MSRELTLVDAGLGNLGSVKRALTQVGSAVQVSSDPDVIAASRTLVFPGQGAFGPATQGLVDSALGEAIKTVIQRGDPYLGICLGMQMLFEGSEESADAKGFGILPGHAKRFPGDMTVEDRGQHRHLKVPHVGWNDVQPTGEHYYFVHSYYIDTEEESDLLWSATYGSIRFAAAVRRENIYGCQFQPEKSQRAGLRFLRAFLLGSRA